MSGINFNTLRGALYYPREIAKRRAESPFANYLSDRHDGIVNVRIYKDGDDITESMGGFPVEEKEFLEYAKEKQVHYSRGPSLTLSLTIQMSC